MKVIVEDDFSGRILLETEMPQVPQKGDYIICKTIAVRDKTMPVSKVIYNFDELGGLQSATIKVLTVLPND